VLLFFFCRVFFSRCFASEVALTSDNDNGSTEEIVETEIQVKDTSIDPKVVATKAHAPFTAFHKFSFTSADSSFVLKTIPDNWELSVDAFRQCGMVAGDKTNWENLLIKHDTLQVAFNWENLVFNTNEINWLRESWKSATGRKLKHPSKTADTFPNRKRELFFLQTRPSHAFINRHGEEFQLSVDASGRFGMLASDETDWTSLQIKDDVLQAQFGFADDELTWMRKSWKSATGREYLGWTSDIDE
jgi:hypothetical protein